MEEAFARGFRDIVLKAESGVSDGSIGIMLACDEGERAYPWPEKQHGVFCHYLLEALSERAADEQGRILFPRVQEHIQRGLAEWSRERPGQRQTPCVQLKGYVTFGELPDALRKKPSARPTMVVEEEPATISLRTEFDGELRVDDHSMGRITAGRRVRLGDLRPGRHTVTIAGEFEWAGELSAGQVLELTAEKKSAASPSQGPPARKKSAAYRWVAILGGVAAVALSVVLSLTPHGRPDSVNRQSRTQHSTGSHETGGASAVQAPAPEVAANKDPISPSGEWPGARPRVRRSLPRRQSRRMLHFLEKYGM